MRKSRKIPFVASHYLNPAYKGMAGFGHESFVFRSADRKGFVHKSFVPGWLTNAYTFGGRLSWLNENRRAKGDKRGGTIRQPSAEEWNYITFILANHTVDVMGKGRELGIPVPKEFRRVKAFINGEEEWVVEMKDLSLKGHSIHSADKVFKPGPRIRPANLNELREKIEDDIRLLKIRGVVQDDLHPTYSAWLIRINNKTGLGERFLVDATNLVSKNK